MEMLKTEFYLWRKLHIALDERIIKDRELAAYEQLLEEKHGDRITATFLKWAERIDGSTY